jgi:hypothetical protein
MQIPGFEPTNRARAVALPFGRHDGAPFVSPAIMAQERILIPKRREAERDRAHEHD